MLTVARIQMPEKGIFLCRVAPALSLTPSDPCMVELDYGIDTGTVLEVFDINDRAESEEKVPAFRVVRKQVATDDQRIVENRALAKKAQQAFMLSVSREKGHVKVLHTRFSFGRERFFIRYVAQFPVDLRRFIGQLQRDFKTQVDLWQIGVRDEAALVGCLGSCGRAVCCCTWQHQCQPVNVKMAKDQEMSLNPVAINGSCGRLKCCLRFEYEQYRVAGAHLPEKGSVVTCGDFENVEGLVIGRDVMRGRLTVRTRDGRFLTVLKDAITVLHAVRTEDTNKEGGDEDIVSEWSES
ncbi:MAG: regulatory iron-sulfur-containing complex subunit RicT [bacterium]